VPLLNLVHVNLHVADLERSIDFYRRLGWELMIDMSRTEPAKFERIDVNERVVYGGGLGKVVILSLGDDPRCATKIELVEDVEPSSVPKPPRPPHEAGVHRLAIRVKDLDGTIALLRGRGIEIRDEPRVLFTMGGRQRYVLLADPDDNLLELIELFRE